MTSGRGEVLGLPENPMTFDAFVRAHAEFFRRNPRARFAGASGERWMGLRAAFVQVKLRDAGWKLVDERGRASDRNGWYVRGRRAA